MADFYLLSLSIIYIIMYRIISDLKSPHNCTDVTLENMENIRIYSNPLEMTYTL